MRFFDSWTLLAGGRIWLPLMILLLLSSCDMFGGGDEDQTQIRFLSFVNGKPALNAQIGGETLIVGAFVPTSTPAGPSSVSSYSTIEAGLRRYQIVRATTEATVVARGNLSLSADTFYTGYLTGTLESASLTVVGDDPPAPPANGAIVRIVHAYTKIGTLEAAIHSVQQSPGGGLEAGGRIEDVGRLAYAETSNPAQITEGQIAVVVTSREGEGPALLLSPIEGRSYTIVVTQPGGEFSHASFGYGVIEEQL